MVVKELDIETFYGNLKSYNELKHHGILGQKWGIRRYQNEDGSLTEAGKSRLIKKAQKFYDPNKQERYDHINDIGAQEEDVTIKKGSKSYHVGDEKWASEKNSRYIFNPNYLENEEQEEFYEKHFWNPLDEDPLATTNIHELETTDDYKIAGTKKVVDYILERYGNKKYSTFNNYSVYENENGITVNDAYELNKYAKAARTATISNQAFNNNKDWRYKDALQTSANANTIIMKLAKEHRDEINDHLVKLGYDAVSDYIDGISGRNGAVIDLTGNKLKSSAKYKNARTAENKIIENYKKEHPNTQLKGYEILENYYSSSKA